MSHIFFREGKCDADAPFLGDVQGVTDGAAIRRVAHETSHQRAVRAMAFAGLRKGAVKRDLRRFQRLPQDVASHLADPRRPGGV